VEVKPKVEEELEGRAPKPIPEGGAAGEEGMGAFAFITGAALATGIVGIDVVGSESIGSSEVEYTGESESSVVRFCFL
jgi:hypothetical protein